MCRIVSFGTILISSLVFSLLFYLSTDASAKKQRAKPVDVREMSARKTFLDCFKELNSRDGGWCEMSGASINDILPKSPSPEIRMRSGPRSVISAWNGAAFDLQRLKMYFHGGGYSDYGGNEVYELDLLRGRWTRLTDPSFMPKSTKEVRCPVPETGPPSSQTFDGIVFSKTTQTIFVIPSVYGCSRGRLSPNQDMWEFNPSQTEDRNGIAPLKWRQRAPMPNWLTHKGYRTAQYEDGQLYIGNRVFEAIFDAMNGTWKKIGARPNYGAGTSVYDASRRGVWSIHRGSILFTTPAIGKKWTATGAGIDGHSGLAMTRDNKLLFWNGIGMVHTLDPETREWRLFDWKREGPKFGGRVYSKWAWVPKYDLYVGYADYKSGVWIYRHPKGRKGKLVNTTSIQHFLNKAATGDSVTVPPGIYHAGATISKSLVLDLKGVRIVGPTKGKGVLLVKNAVGPVVIKNFRTRDRVRCGNCSGIKIEGKNFHVTVRNSHISNTEMGILTDNKGGRLIVEDTLIEDVGHARGREPMHLIYAGIIDKLRVTRSTLRRSHYFGHILKSRARSTEVSDSYLLSLGSVNSREADLPCGGVIKMTRVVIQKGPKSDNNESFGVGLEPRNCLGALHPKTTFSLTDSWLIFDRAKSQFGHWKGKVKPIISDNRIVGLRTWGSFKDHSRLNKMFPNRIAAGLKRGEIPTLSFPLPAGTKAQ